MHGMDRKTNKITGDPRRAGQVSRYHTWPHLKPQSVAEHSWQVQRILLAIWPDAEKDILVYALLHDIGEVATGDLPFPMKARNPKLKEIMDIYEYDAHLSMCLPWNLPPPRKLQYREIAIFKLADYIEMWEWALDEISFGNKNAELVRERCSNEIAYLITVVDEDIRNNAEEYLRRRENETHD